MVRFQFCENLPTKFEVKRCTDVIQARMVQSPETVCLVLQKPAWVRISAWVVKQWSPSLCFLT